MGEWREVTSEDKSQSLSILFRPNQTFVFRTTAHAPEPRSASDELQKFFGTLTGTYSQGDSVIVFDLDEEEFLKRFAALQRSQGDTTELPDIGSVDLVYRYKLSGDVLELTEEPTKSSPVTYSARYVRVKP